MDNQQVLLKDIVKDKTFQELIDLLPLKVCVEHGNTDARYWSSYDVIGFGKDTVLLGYSVSYYDDDESFGDGMAHVKAFRSLSIGNIPDNYIVVHGPTPKQRQFLEKFTNVDPSEVCGYQAHQIISNIIERWKKEKEQKQKIRENANGHAYYKDYYDYYDDYPAEIGINGF